jgi:hypothetical protein
MFLGAGLCLASTLVSAQDPGDDDQEPNAMLVSEAREVAEMWLAAVDSGAYRKSWTDAAAFFKKAVASTEWVEQLNQVRRPLGAVTSRTFTNGTYTDSLPMAPKGEYVVLQYATSFEAHPGGTETVTPMKDPDGEWRVAGYYIK